MNKLIWLLPLALCSCASVSENNHSGFFPRPGMHEDAQDFPTKYNQMDSCDGGQDPNAKVKIWRTTY